MFPRLAPTTSGVLELPDGQTLYWEESGNPDGVPAVYLHGGPGGGLGGGGYITKFDTSRFRVVAFDQRGCGRSVPLANDPAHDLSRNTTQTLIADLETLRETLGIDSWVLNGVSWGSTLALAYALAHPERVNGIVIMAVTTSARAEIDWITEQVGAIYPEGWDRFASYAEQAGVGYRRFEGRIVGAYAQLLRDPVSRAAATAAWGEWEDTHVAIGAGGFERDPRWRDQGWAEKLRHPRHPLLVQRRVPRTAHPRPEPRSWPGSPGS